MFRLQMAVQALKVIASGLAQLTPENPVNIHI